MKKYLEVFVIANFCVGIILVVLISFMSGFYISEKMFNSKSQQEEGPKTYIIPKGKGNVEKGNEKRIDVCLFLTGLSPLIVFL